MGSYKRQRTGGRKFGGNVRYNNSTGGTSYHAKHYRGGGGGGYRTGGFRGTEVKFFDTQLQNTTITPNLFEQGTSMNPTDASAVKDIGCLFAPAQGTSATSRIGRTVVMKRITLKGTIKSSQEELALGESPSPLKVRILIVQDTQNNHRATGGPVNLITEGVLTNVIKNDSIAFSPVNVVNAFTNLENVRRFKILSDRTMVLNQSNALKGGDPSSVGEVGSAYRNFVFDKACNIPVMMTSAGSTVAGISDNAVFVYALCTNSEESGVLQSAELSYVCRVRYMDA